MRIVSVIIITVCLVVGCAADDGDKACEGVDFVRSNGEDCTPSVNDQICYFEEDVPCGDGSMLEGIERCSCKPNPLMNDTGRWQCYKAGC